MTKESQVIEGNKLIGEFMGAKRSTVDGDKRYLRFPDPHAGTDTYAFYPRELKYHSSWDWLMPVVEKIIQIDGVDVETLNWLVKIKYDDGENVIVISSMDSLKKKGATMIQAYYNTVVQFIQWYNQKHQP